MAPPQLSSHRNWTVSRLDPGVDNISLIRHPPGRTRETNPSESNVEEEPRTKCSGLVPRCIHPDDAVCPPPGPRSQRAVAERRSPVTGTVKDPSRRVDDNRYALRTIQSTAFFAGLLVTLDGYVQGPPRGDVHHRLRNQCAVVTAALSSASCAVRQVRGEHCLMSV